MSNYIDDVGDFWEDTWEDTSDFFEDVGDSLGDLAKGIGDTIEGVLKDPLPMVLSVAGSFVGIPPWVTMAALTAARGGDLEDIAKSAAVSFASSAFMTGTQIGADIQSYTSNAWAGDFTDAMANTFDLSATAQVAIAKAATSAINGAILGGMRSAIMGDDILKGMGSGFTSGAVYSSTDSFFDSVNKDQEWGLSSKALSVAKGATSSALMSMIAGKGDPAAAVGNYIAYASMQMGTSELSKSAKSAYEDLLKNVEITKTSGEEFSKVNEEYQTQKKDYESKIGETNSLIEQYQEELNKIAPDNEKLRSIETEYNDITKQRVEFVNQFKNIDEAYHTYDDRKRKFETPVQTGSDNNFGLDVVQQGGEDDARILRDARGALYTPSRDGDDWVLRRIDSAFNAPDKEELLAQSKQIKAQIDGIDVKQNELLTGYNTLADKIKPAIDGLNEKAKVIEAKTAEAKAIEKNILVPEGDNLAAKYKEAADKYNTTKSAFETSQTNANAAAEAFEKAKAEVAVLKATTDLVNSGVIQAERNQDGSYTLSNGMTIDTNGKFFQNGNQLFTNASDVPPPKLEFKDKENNSVSFDEKSGFKVTAPDTTAPKETTAEPKKEEPTGSVISVDTDNNTALVVTPNGDVQTVTVDTSTVKEGDTINVDTGKVSNPSEKEEVTSQPTTAPNDSSDEDKPEFGSNKTFSGYDKNGSKIYLNPETGNYSYVNGTGAVKEDIFYDDKGKSIVEVPEGPFGGNNTETSLTDILKEPATGDNAEISRINNPDGSYTVKTSDGNTYEYDKDGNLQSTLVSEPVAPDPTLTPEQQWAKNHGVLNEDGTIDWASYDIDSGVGTGSTGPEQTEQEVRDQLGKNFDLVYPNGYPGKDVPELPEVKATFDDEEPDNWDPSLMGDWSTFNKPEPPDNWDPELMGDWSKLNPEERSTAVGGTKGTGGGGIKTPTVKPPTPPVTPPVKPPVTPTVTPTAPVAPVAAAAAASPFMTVSDLNKPVDIKYYTDMASQGILPQQPETNAAQFKLEKDRAEKEKEAENSGEGDFAYGGLINGYDDEFTIEDLLNMLRS